MFAFRQYSTLVNRKGMLFPDASRILNTSITSPKAVSGKATVLRPLTKSEYLKANSPIEELQRWWNDL